MVLNLLNRSFIPENEFKPVELTSEPGLKAKTRLVTCQNDKTATIPSENVTKINFEKFIFMGLSSWDV